MNVENMISLHKEWEQVCHEHASALDSFVDEDENWILGDEEKPICKSGELQVKFDFLEKVYNDQVDLLNVSRCEIETEISRLEDAFGQFQTDYPY